MPKIYLLGGEDVFRRSARDINLAALENAATSPNVAVFAWARPSFDKKYRKRKMFTDYLRSLGADEVGFVEYGEEEDYKQKLAVADVVYFTGGQTSILIERAKKAGLDKLLSGFEGVIVGRSAGALALCRRCITTIRENHRVRVVNGLGLVDITLKAHYTAEKDEALKWFSHKETIFAVPKDSALICNDGHLTAVGNVYLFKEGQSLAFTESDL